MISYHPCAGVWNHWKSEVSEFQYPDSATIDFGSMLVPNVDSVRTEYLINAIAKQGKVGSNYRLSSVGWILKSNFFFPLSFWVSGAACHADWRARIS